MAIGHSRLVKKEDLIKPILNYFKIKLEKESIDSLRSIVYQILLKENKELEKKTCQIYRDIIEREGKEFEEYKKRLMN